MGKIVVVGSINMDLVVRTPRVPALGETIIGDGFMTAPGGKGANQACAAARLGGDVRMLGCIGADAFGRQLRENLEASGVVTDDIRTVRDAPSGVAVIVVHDGDNSIVIDPGANHRITPEDVRAFAPRIEAADIVLVQLEIPLSVVEETVRVASEVGTPVLLNPAPAVELSAETLARVTYLTPNESEAAILSGKTPGEQVDLEATIAELTRRGVPTVCTTLGTRGVGYAHGGSAIEYRPAYRVKAVDTTAAGDVFSGALAVALTEGVPFENAVDFAQKASAIAVTRAGAGPSIPTRDEVEQFHAGHV